MAIPPDAGFEAAKAGIETIRSLASIIDKSTKEDNRLSHSEAIQKMGADVHRRAKELRLEVRRMQKSLNILADRNYDIDKPLAEVRKQGWFYRILPFSPYKMLRNFNTRVGSVTHQINSLFEDAIAVANCREAEDEIALAVAKSQRQIDGLGNRPVSAFAMGDLVERFLIELDELVEQTRKL